MVLLTCSCNVAPLAIKLGAISSSSIRSMESSSTTCWYAFLSKSNVCQSGTTIWEYFVLECQSGLSKWYNHLGVFCTWYIQYVQKIHTIRKYKREVLRRSISMQSVHDWQLRTNKTARLEETKFEEYIHAYTRVNRGLC